VVTLAVGPADHLATALPGGSADEHAVEMAIGRLRTALGNPRMIQTLVKRGYRIAYDPEGAGRY
jgi:uroporphyrinogen-III synthase